MRDHGFFRPSMRRRPLIATLVVAGFLAITWAGSVLHFPIRAAGLSAVVAIFVASLLRWGVARQACLVGALAAVAGSATAFGSEDLAAADFLVALLGYACSLFLASFSRERRSEDSAEGRAWFGEQASVAMVITEGRTILYANEATATMLRRPRSELIGNASWQDFVGAEDRDRMDAAMESGGAFTSADLHFRFRWPDGSVRTARGLGMPSDVAGATSPYWFSLIRDVTDEQGAGTEPNFESAPSLLRERQRIARELHRHLSQRLTALALGVASLRLDEAGAEGEQRHALLDEVCESALLDLRELIEELIATPGTQLGRATSSFALPAKDA